LGEGGIKAEEVCGLGGGGKAGIRDDEAVMLKNGESDEFEVGKVER
jgi:hypothetical protein